MAYKMFARVAGAVLLAIAPASAIAATPPAPAVFNFTVGSNTNVQDGNVRIFSATSPDLGTYSVRVTAWSLLTTNGVTTVQDSKLMVYGGGLGVISGDDGNGDMNRHTIDNQTRKDFVLMQFDRHVRFMSATFNTYSVGNTGYKDSDATFKYGALEDSGLVYGSSLGFLNTADVSALNALFDGSFNSRVSTPNSNTRTINPGRFSGNLWLIGADFSNTDKIDGFKLTNLAVVPEPGTWAMLILGFGATGAALRTRRRALPAAA